MNKALATVWIAKNRVPDCGDIDIATMANYLKVRLVYKQLSGKLQGFIMPEPHSDSPYEYVVVIDNQQTLEEQLFTFGHELGHYYCFERGHRGGLFNPNPKLEEFCDWFAEVLID